MRLSSSVWLEQGFYIDIDHLGQLRVVGPGDHLYFGMVSEELRDFDITKVFSKGKKLFISGYFYESKIKFFYPLMGDIRTVRTYIYGNKEEVKTYYYVRNNYSDVLSPTKVSFKKRDGKQSIIFERHFGKNFYGTEIILNNNIEIKQKESFFYLKTKEPVIDFTIMVYDNGFYRPDFYSKAFKSRKINYSNFDIRKDIVKDLLNRTQIECEHLLKYRKTSSFDYGTVFPRDWTEAALLGFDDFNEKTIKYIMEESFKYVTLKGEGWHEHGVGEFAYNHNKNNEKNINRDMIDIEPRYILSFGKFPKVFINNKLLLRKVKRVANYILEQAEKNYFIKFEEIPQFKGFKAGNWRDSFLAYSGVSSNIVSFDTNAVFYPMALKVIADNAKILEVNKNFAKRLFLDWKNKKDLFRFQDKKGNSAFALALYDFKDKRNFKKLKVDHTDEAYDLIFGNPEERDVKSLVKRILSYEYFRTACGPIIVGKHEGYKSSQYHGEVIWIKQAGILSLGFRKQYLRRDISKTTKKLLKEAIGYLYESLMCVFEYQNLLPELHIDKKGLPVLYSEQGKTVEGHMNKIQFWSCEAARRIVFDYYDTFFRS